MARHYFVGPHALKIGGVLYSPGSEIPVAALRVLSDAEGASLVGSGAIVGRDTIPMPPAPPVRGIKPRDKGAPAETGYPQGVDPASLQGKDLQSLNLMLVERSLAAAATVEEAIGTLSRDFKPS